MNYKQYENSTCIIDKSGTQTLFYFPNDKKFKPFEFFIKNKIDLVFADSSLAQYSFQDYPNCQKTLFTGAEVVSAALTSKTAGEQEVQFVMSKINATITLKDIEPSGYPVYMESSLIQISSLWDASPFMINSKNFIDKQIIHTARNKEKNHKKVFILTEDQGIIKQIKSLELIKYLRSVDVLKWMVKDKFISQQKGVAVFNKWKTYNWIHGIESFKDI